MSKTPGTSGTMPITGAACGIKPSKKAMEVDFEIDFSQAKQFLNQPKTLLMRWSRKLILIKYSW